MKRSILSDKAEKESILLCHFFDHKGSFITRKGHPGLRLFVGDTLLSSNGDTLVSNIGDTLLSPVLEVITH